MQGGAVKALVVAVDERSPAVPDVPTANEAGLPEFKAETWTGLYAPKGTPPDVLAQLARCHCEVACRSGGAAALHEHRREVPKSERQGGDYMLKLVTEEVERWSAIVKKAGVELKP